MTQPGLVAIVGGLDLSTVVRWEAELGKAATTSRAVVIDLSGVEFVDSAGVHGLFRMLGALDEQGKRAIVVAPHGGRVRRLLEILDLPTLAWMYETREEALERARDVELATRASYRRSATISSVSGSSTTP